MGTRSENGCLENIWVERDMENARRYDGNQGGVAHYVVAAVKG